MTKPEAEHLIGVTRYVDVLLDRIVGEYWSEVAKQVDISDLEADGEMFEAIAALILFGLLRACERQRIGMFDMCVADARRFEQGRAQAERVLNPVN